MAILYLHKITEVLKKLDHEGDPITYSKQIEQMMQFLNQGFRNDQEIRDLFLHFNTMALSSEDIAINLAHLLTSRKMDSIKLNSQTTIRNEVLRILQNNFASKFRQFTSRYLLGLALSVSPMARPTSYTILGESSCIIQRASD